MKKKILSLILVISILLLSIQSVNAEVIPIYAGVNSINDSAIITKNLPASNYNLYVNVQACFEWDSSSVAYFNITKNDMVYFTVLIDHFDYDYELEKRLIITEAGEYTFTFWLKAHHHNDYVDFEVVLSEIEIIYQTKTSIIAEAPYGLGIIGIALIGMACIYIRRRRRKGS